LRRHGVDDPKSGEKFCLSDLRRRCIWHLARSHEGHGDMTDYRNLTTKETATQCVEVYEDGDLVARIVPHESETGWMIVNLAGKPLTMQPYETVKLALNYLPLGLPKRAQG
jgi:hypothetical protein